MTKQKVFAVGFHKTATTSLACALYVLGYRLGGYRLNGFDDGQLRALSPEQARAKIWKHMETILPDLDAVQDIPWPVFYRELDAAYPGSKFILTTRETESWIASVQQHFGSKRIPQHEWIYGVPCATGHEDVYRARYQQHNAEVLKYFVDRPDDLLVFGPDTGMSWGQLCDFLECEEPPFPFPRQNQASSIDRSLTGRLTRVGRRALHRATQQPTDHEMALDLQQASQVVVDRFETKVTERLQTGSQDLDTVYTDINRTLCDVSGRVQVLKDFLGLSGSTEPPRAVNSPEAFVDSWKSQVLELRHMVGSTNNQTVRSLLTNAGPSVHDAVKEIEQVLQQCEQRIGAS